jgi:hemolysin activation/secretion protein
VTDNGVIGSLEVRIPVWRDALGRHRVQLVPFVDVGHAWNHASPEPPEETLASVGLGLRAQVTEWARGEFFWGQRLVDVPNPKTSAQDYGIYFQVVIDAF